MWTREERGSINGQFGSKLAAARRRRKRKQPPYPHDNDILRWRGEPENPLRPLLALRRWVSVEEVQEVYGLKTRHAAYMVISNLRTHGFKFDNCVCGRWRLTYIPPFQEPKNEPVFIEEQVIDEISGQPDITGDELRAKLPDLNEGQIRQAVDNFRARRVDETVEGQYQPGFTVARRPSSR